MKLIFPLLLSAMLLAACEPRSPNLPADGIELVTQTCWFSAEVPADCYHLNVTEVGQQFQLPVVVLRATQPAQSAVLYLSGGPGGSAFLSAEDMIYWQAQYQRMALDADLVLVDRRGTGLAQPQLQCDVFRRQYRRALAKNLPAHRENDLIFQAMTACFDQHLSPQPEAERIAVSALGTAADTRDMLTLMDALPYAQWHVWGVSYGTRLALSVAAQRPLTSLVLDSIYPPGRGQSEEWPALMNSAMQRFFSWCDRHQCARELPVAIGQSANSEQNFQQVLSALDSRPVILSLPSWYGEAPYTLTVNGQRFLQIVFSAIYDQYLWPDIGQALQELPVRNETALRTLAENFINNAFDPLFSELVFYAAECKDNAPSASEAVQSALAQSPHYRRYLEGQMQWDVCGAELFSGLRGAEQLSLDLPATVSAPVLMLSGALDPITPVEWVVPLQNSLPLWQAARFEEVGHAVVASDVCAEQLLANFIRRPERKLQLSGGACTAERIALQHSEQIQ